jgi:hypothetical protein
MALLVYLNFFQGAANRYLLSQVGLMLCSAYMLVFSTLGNKAGVLLYAAVFCAVAIVNTVALLFFDKDTFVLCGYGLASSVYALSLRLTDFTKGDLGLQFGVDVQGLWPQYVIPILGALLIGLVGVLLTQSRLGRILTVRWTQSTGPGFAFSTVDWRRFWDGLAAAVSVRTSRGARGASLRCPILQRGSLILRQGRACLEASAGFSLVQCVKSRGSGRSPESGKDPFLIQPA